LKLPRRPGMDLGNMRSNGVRSIRADCGRCGHSAAVNLDAYSDEETVPSFAGVMRCTACESRSIRVMLNWIESPLTNPLRCRRAELCC
jgi:hypothetical protein